MVASHAKAGNIARFNLSQYAGRVNTHGLSRTLHNPVTKTAVVAENRVGCLHCVEQLMSQVLVALVCDLTRMKNSVMKSLPKAMN